VAPLPLRYHRWCRVCGGHAADLAE